MKPIPYSFIHTDTGRNTTGPGMDHCKGMTVGPNPEIENSHFPALLDLSQKDKQGKVWAVFHKNEHLNHMYYMQFPGG